MDFQLFYPEGAVPELIFEINHAQICNNAKFKLDHPLPYDRDRVFRLRNGQLFLVEGTEEHALDGRWAVIQK